MSQKEKTELCENQGSKTNNPKWPERLKKLEGEGKVLIEFKIQAN